MCPRLNHTILSDDWDRHNLVVNIVGGLQHSRFVLRKDSPFCAAIHGCLYLRGEEAKIDILLPADWRQDPPIIWCREPWIKRKIDWHVYSGGGLCWVHHKEWRRYHREPQFWIDATCGYLFRNVTYLIERHLIGHMLGLSDWSPGWEQYAHGKEAEGDIREWKREFNAILRGPSGQLPA